MPLWLWSTMNCQSSPSILAIYLCFLRPLINSPWVMLPSLLVSKVSNIFCRSLKLKPMCRSSSVWFRLEDGTIVRCSLLIFLGLTSTTDLLSLAILLLWVVKECDLSSSLLYPYFSAKSQNLQRSWNKQKKKLESLSSAQSRSCSTK